jgi:hypothetical protein
VEDIISNKTEPENVLSFEIILILKGEAIPVPGHGGP